MNRPFMNFQNFMNDFQQLTRNPAQYMMTKYGIPQDIAGNPDAIIQKMMQEGRITQQQYNDARKAASEIQKNPMFGQIMGIKK